MNDYTINEMKEIVAPIAHRYGVERIFLFGSRARGDNTPGSDIDLRVDRGGAKGFALGGLYEDLSEAFHVDLDLLTTGSLDEDFLQKIRSDEVLLYDQQGM
ncbi:nucleotidyltransferase domain-containing protein [Oscillospiraceae bacterium 42-9]